MCLAARSRASPRCARYSTHSSDASLQNELLVIDLNQKTPTCQKHTLKVRSHLARGNMHTYTSRHSRSRHLRLMRRVHQKVPASAAPALCDHSASELLLYSEGHIFTLSVPECKATEIKLKGAPLSVSVKYVCVCM